MSPSCSSVSGTHHYNAQKENGVSSVLWNKFINIHLELFVKIYIPSKIKDISDAHKVHFYNMLEAVISVIEIGDMLYTELKPISSHMILVSIG